VVWLRDKESWGQRVDKEGEREDRVGVGSKAGTSGKQGSKEGRQQERSSGVIQRPLMQCDVYTAALNHVQG